MSLHHQAMEIVSKLTLEEKCKLCVGKNFWQLYGVDSLSIPSIWLSDGPHGLRKEIIVGKNVFNNETEKSVCYPTGIAIASTFDEDLIFKMGKAIGEECREKDVAVILGPGASEIRLPICGRNFEYFSEDPYLTGKIAAAYIKGVQSQGVGTSIKHLFGNNQEKNRMSINSIIDERALREIYLRGIEIAIKEANPWTVMMAYNRLNGNYCSENSRLIKDIIRKEWGYEGLIISDWGGVNNFIHSRKSGLDLEMPGYEDDYYKVIKEYVDSGELSEEILDESVIKIIELTLKYKKGKEIPYVCNIDEHIKLAQTIAEESAVLLKNEDNILPGNEKQNIAIIGELAKHPRYQGLGSSEVNPICLDNAYEAFFENGCEVSYAKGYSLENDSIDEELLLQEAINVCRDKDIVYLFIGIPSHSEAEGIDSKEIKLPKSQDNLIREISKINKNLVVILQGGKPIEMEWASLCKGILLTHLGGSRSGHATVNLLLGYKNPCGKLSQTFPKYLKDCPGMKYYLEEDKNAQYRESIYVGYRYYDTAKIKVEYPFGYGLSYTNFEYSNLNIKYDYKDLVTISLAVTNTGKREGKEVVQLYVSCFRSDLFRAKKELKSFKKVSLGSGEKKGIKFNIDRNSFEYYNIESQNFQVEPGYYMIELGSSSHNIRLSKLIYIMGDKIDTPNYKDITPCYYKLDKKEFHVSEDEFKLLNGGELPVIDENIRPFTTNSTIKDIKTIKGGKLLVSIINKKAKEITGEDEMLKLMLEENLEDMPFRSFTMITRGNISRKFIDGFVDFLNQEYLKGLKIMIQEIIKTKE